MQPAFTKKSGKRYKSEAAFHFSLILVARSLFQSRALVFIKGGLRAGGHEARLFILDILFQQLLGHLWRASRWGCQAETRSPPSGQGFVYTARDGDGHPEGPQPEVLSKTVSLYS